MGSQSHPLSPASICAYWNDEQRTLQSCSLPFQNVDVVPTRDADAKLRPVPAYTLLADARSCQLGKSSPRGRWLTGQGRRDTAHKKGYRHEI